VAKSGPELRKFPLQQTSVGAPFDRIGIVIVGPYPDTENVYEYLIVICDYY
jgi:hypothetical protein